MREIPSFTFRFAGARPGKSALTGASFSTLSGVAAALMLAAPAALADHPTGGVAGAGAGPINTATATTLPQGLFALSLGTEYIDVDRYSDAEIKQFAANDVDAHSADWELVPYIAAAYGVSNDLTIGARLPYLAMNDVRTPTLDAGQPAVSNDGNVHGIGDLTAFTEYRFFNDRKGQSEAAVFVGLKLPTGDERQHADSGDLFETENQPGSGSWDPILGLAATHRWGRHTLSANVLYTATNEGTQSTELGNIFSYNLGWSYHVGGPEPHAAGSAAPKDAPPATAGSTLATEGVSNPPAPSSTVPSGKDLGWDAVLELNGIRRQEQTVDGARDDNSGGNTLYLSPGVRVPMSAHSSFFTSVGVPLFQHLNGAEHQTDLRAMVGMSFAF
jgi:Putative MetA-pathway of phenol degradation